MSAGTYLSRLNITEIIPVAESILLSQILENSPEKDRFRIRKYFKNLGLIPPATFSKIVDILKDMAPSSRTLLSRFGEKRNAIIKNLPEKTKEILAEQKETLSTALNISGIDRKFLHEWELGHDQIPQSFLEGLSSARLREDPMVINDFRKFPGFDYVRELPFNAAIFQNRTTRLTTILANRTPLEELLGTDLIYYNETYSSFIFLQYKALEYEGGDKGFRIPDKQLNVEIDRMQKILRVINSFPDSSSLNDYRLNNNPFFLKFCSRMVFEPDDTSLIPGMYIPLDMWNLLITSDTVLGPRGGQVISYNSVTRYFDNTEFAVLVNKSWIGTYGDQSKLLEEIIKETIETGKAVTIAIKSNLPIEEQEFPPDDFDETEEPFFDLENE